MVYIVPALFLLACAALSRLSPSGTAPGTGEQPRGTPAARGLDADGDGALDPRDNCPLTPNANQADVDANGLGDECDSPFAAGLAFIGEDGVIELTSDDRLRVTQIVTPSARLDLTWSDDASHLEITVENEQVQETFALTMDFSDEALLAALEAGEQETGEDLGPYRDWIAQNPGRIQAVVRGQAPPPVLGPTPTSNVPGAKARMAVSPTRRFQMDIDDYLFDLMVTSMIAENALYTFGEAHPESDPAAATARVALLAAWINANGFFVEESRACRPCSAACRIPCALDTGACYTDPEAFGDPRDPGPCYEITERACTDRGGVSFPENKCPSACWFTNPEFADLPTSERCAMTDYFTCWDMPNRANQQQRGGEGLNVTTLFCAQRTCGDPICTP
jgi:hypothetical protein